MAWTDELTSSELRQIARRIEHGLPLLVPGSSRRLRWMPAAGGLKVSRITVQPGQNGRPVALAECEGEPAAPLPPWIEPTHREQLEQLTERRRLRDLLREHGPVHRVAGWKSRRHGWTCEVQGEPELLVRAFGDAHVIERTAGRVLLRATWPELLEHVQARLTG